MFFIVDNYAKTIEYSSEKREDAEKQLEEMTGETGIFIWSIVEAKDAASIQFATSEE
jgi:hypothetical protein